MKDPIKIQYYQKIREIVSNPKTWTQGTLARDKNSREVYCNTPEAVCWCAKGAAYIVASQFKNNSLFSDFIEADLTSLGINKNLWEINDEDGQQAVLDLLDKLIEKYST